MRNYDPDEKWHKDTIEKLQPEQYMLDALRMNPSYTAWGPYEE